ncbi:MAG: hypothetical protein IVW57_09685 [Ktedonobacterales bacterium]|nr:hypothetical protein [Ktedonobacterales bacterium]
MRHLQKPSTFGLLILAASLGLAACGVTTSTSTGTNTSPNTTVNGSCGTVPPAQASSVTTAVITPVRTIVIQPGGGVAGGTQPATTAGATSGAASLTPIPNTTVTPGQLTTTSDRSRYSLCDTIQVVIANGLQASVTAADHQTSCSLVTLQRLVNGTWAPQGRCPLETPTRLYEIAPGTAIAQQLTPGSGSFSRTGASGWAAGTYRIAFTYFTGSASSRASRQNPPIYSATFTIG